MSTQPTASSVVRRVAARTGVGIWRHRGSALLALAAIAGGLTYMSLGGASLASLPLQGGAAIGANATDCADTAMAAIADKSPTAAQRAYQCMDPSFQQRVTEQSFVQQVQAQALPNVSSVSRVGDYQAPAGGSMVYYAVDANGQSVGYIVYVGQSGKVLRIE